MNLYRLERKDDVGYDEYEEKIVYAKTSSQARKIANEVVGDEGEIWTNIKLVSCKRIEKKIGEVSSSYRAG